MLNDINNKPSSKRIWANRILWVSLLMAMVWFGVFIGAIILGKSPIEPFPYQLFLILFGTGVVNLGMTLFEQKK